MATLGRSPGAAPLTSVDIPDDSITAAKIVAGAVSSDVLYLENNISTQTLSGTYSTERLYFNDSYQLTGDVTVTGHLALGSIADEDVVITQDSTERTITGSGTLEAGELLSSKETDLTGMTGELGSVVTGSPNLNLTTGLSNSLTSFPAGHIIQSSLLTPYSLPSDITTTLTSAQSTVGASGELSMVTRGTNSKFIIHYSGNYFHSSPTSNKGPVSYIHFCNGTWAGVGANVTASTAQGSGLFFNTYGWQDIVGQITAVHTPTYTKGDTLRWREYFHSHSSNTGNCHWHHSGGLQADSNSGTAYYQGWAMEVAQ